MVSVAVRAAPVFAATVTVTVPEPAPLAGLAVAQEESLVAVQPQAVLLADTVTLLVVPSAVADSSVDEIPYVHESADWLTV
jgi:hypothetical protein